LSPTSHLFKLEYILQNLDKKKRQGPKAFNEASRREGEDAVKNITPRSERAKR